MMSYPWKKSKEARIPWIMKIFPIQPCHQRGPLVGSPGTLNPGLIPLQKTTKILQKKKSQKMCLCAASDPHEKYAYLFRSHWLVVKMILPSLIRSKTWAQMLSLLIKHGQKSTKYHLRPYETQFLCTMWMEHETPPEVLPMQRN